MTKFAFKGLAAIAVLALGACSHEADIVERTQPVEVRHPIAVEPHIREFQVASNAAGLSEEDRDGLRSAAQEYLSGGHGKITVSSPNGLASARPAVRSVADSIAVLQSAGVPRNRIEVGSYSGSAVLVSYIMYTATGPDCSNFSQDIGFDPENRATPNFGCATQSNTAAMLEDPRDLIAPRNEEPASSARRAAVIKAYREGQVTSATRNDQDSGAVSTVGR